jgi:hypothetical protein
MKVKDKEFLAYNKRNCLTNLLQAENHIKAMNTLNFIKGEGSCVLKHLLFVRGELNEAISHASRVEPKNVKTFEKLYRQIENFLKKIEKKHEYKKRDLLVLVRGWRKELEATMPFYQTFRCKCLHFIPYAKVLLIFLSGIFFAYFLFKLFVGFGV